MKDALLPSLVCQGALFLAPIDYKPHCQGTQRLFHESVVRSSSQFVTFYSVVGSRNGFRSWTRPVYDLIRTTKSYDTTRNYVRTSIFSKLMSNTSAYHTVNQRCLSVHLERSYSTCQDEFLAHRTSSGALLGKSSMTVSFKNMHIHTLFTVVRCKGMARAPRVILCGTKTWWFADQALFGLPFHGMVNNGWTKNIYILNKKDIFLVSIEGETQKNFPFSFSGNFESCFSNMAAFTERSLMRLPLPSPV